jgi:hypothetical protein
LSQSAIIFDETGFEFQRQENGVSIWYTPKNDGLGLFHYPIPPDIGADLNDIESIRFRYRQLANEVGFGIIEVETVIVNDCKAVRTLFKAAQQPTGRTYVGSLTFPFRDFSYVLKVQCAEFGTTGIRDSLILDTMMGSGEVEIDMESDRITGWLDDPYNPREIEPMTRNKSERPEYDAQFPDHPLSRARWVLNHLEQSVNIDDTVKRQPGFVYPS